MRIQILTMPTKMLNHAPLEIEKVGIDLTGRFEFLSLGTLRCCWQPCLEGGTRLYLGSISIYFIYMGS